MPLIAGVTSHEGLLMLKGKRGNDITWGSDIYIPLVFFDLLVLWTDYRVDCKKLLPPFCTET